MLVIWEWIKSHFFNLILPGAGGIGFLITLIWFICWLFERSQKKKEREEDLRQLQNTIRVEIDGLRQELKLGSIYSDGLTKIEEESKAKTILEALKAMRNYDYDKAIGKFQEYLPLTSNEDERAAVLNMLGLSQWKNGRTCDAEKTFRELIDFAEKNEVEDILLSAYGNLGVVYGVSGKTDKAHPIFLKIKSLAEKSGDQNSLAKSLTNIGNVLMNKGDLAAAFDYFKRALVTSRKIGNEAGRAGNLGSIGIIFMTEGEFYDLRKALRFHQSALRIHKKINDYEGVVLDVLNIGLVCYFVGDYDNAHKYLDYTLNFVEKNIKNPRLQAILLGNIAGVYAQIGLFETSLNYYRRSKELFDKMGLSHLVTQTDKNIASVKEEMRRKR